MKAPLHPGADPTCDMCSGTGLAVKPGTLFLTTEPCACTGPCPSCHGTGWIKVGQGFRAPLRRCGCAESASRAERFNTARIPSRYADARLPEVDRSGHRFLTFTMAYQFTDRWTRHDPPRGFILHGPVGTGKTFLLAAVVRHLVLQRGASARFIEFSHLLSDLKSAFDRGGGAADLLDPLGRVDVLAIDELGKGRNTEFELSLIDDLVSRRYNGALPILATTNYEPGAATGRAVANLAEAHTLQPTLGDRVGDRVWSRLRELCDMAPMPGDDKRAEAAQSRRSSARNRTTR